MRIRTSRSVRLALLPPRLKPYLGLAPAFGVGNAAALTPLHYNQSEVEEVNTLTKGLVLSGMEASKKSFLEQQSGYRIIHLATHGKAHSGSGDFSFLGFSGDTTTQLEEMKLFVREIYNLQTNAEMIVLSACETGIGEVQTGEGMASIARSFSYAGAQSLMATQWSVDDKATKELVRSFFENIKKALPKDQALRDAQLEFLVSHGTKEAHPYFWAAMIPIGDMTPIGNSRPFLWIGLVLILVLLGWIILWWKKKRPLL